MKLRLLLIFILLTLALEVQSSAGGLRQDAPPDVCQQSENILPNCNFDNGTSGWQTFIEEGSANFSVLQGGGECHAPLCPAGYIVTQDYFVGGIFQQVQVVKGNTYYGNIVWLVFDSLANDNSINSVVGGISRKVGIDPFGGTDSRSPNIVWGPENTRNDCKICASQEVTATAQAGKARCWRVRSNSATWRGWSRMPAAGACCVSTSWCSHRAHASAMCARGRTAGCMC